MKPTIWPKGLLTALVTPLRDDSLDLKALSALIDFQIGEGAAGLVMSGGTGEYNFMTLDERKALFQAAVEYADARVPVIAATGCLATRDTIALSQAAEKAGASGLLLTSAFGEPINWRERTNFYRQVGEAVNIPIMVYNTPPAGLLTFEQICELSELPNISAVKDSSGDPTLMGDLLDWSRNTEFGVYVGLDSFMFEAVAGGATGAVFGTGNFIPGELSHIISLLQSDGKFQEARSAWVNIRRLLRFMEQTSNYVAMCKIGCGLRGIDVGPMRLPNLMPETAEIDQLRSHLAQLNL